jgi:hypothetical protein
MEHWRIVALEFFLTFVFLVFEFYFGWSSSHLVTWILAGFTLAGGMLIALPWPLRLSIPPVGLVLLMFLVVAPFLPPNETEFHGWLTPGNLPSPKVPNQCADAASIPDTLSVFLGSNVQLIPAARTTSDVITANGDSLLSFQRTPDGIAVTATVYDEQGTVVTVVHNEFERATGGASFRMERPDRHSLTVYDRWNKPVFGVTFLNPSAISVTGVFRHPPSGAILTITADYLRCIVTFHASCFGSAELCKF